MVESSFSIEIYCTHEHSKHAMFKHGTTIVWHDSKRTTNDSNHCWQTQQNCNDKRTAQNEVFTAM